MKEDKPTKAPSNSPESIRSTVVANIGMVVILAVLAVVAAINFEIYVTATIGAVLVALGGVLQLVYRKNGGWLWPQNLGNILTAVGGVLVAVSVIQTIKP